MSQRKSQVSAMLDLEAQLANQKSRILLDLKSEASAAILSQLLRGYRGRSDFSKLAQVEFGSSFIEALEIARGYIFENKLQEAYDILTTISVSDSLERAELEIEWARFYVGTQNHQQALKTIASVLNNSSTRLISRVTALQIRGHIEIVAQKYENAVETLKQAIAYSDLVPFSTAATSCYACLSIAYVKMSKKEDALRELESLRRVIAQIENEEQYLLHLLYLTRAEVRYSHVFSPIEEHVGYIMEAIQIARWLGEGSQLRKSLEDLSLAESTLGRKITRSPAVVEFSNWCFLRQKNIILSHSPKLVSRLQEHPITIKILEALKDGPVTKEKLFNAAWGLEYSPERHGPHLRSILSKVRKHLPPGALLTIDGEVSLR